MSIPYKWSCSFTINGLRVPANTTIDGIKLETNLLKDGTSKTTGNFILELSEKRLPEKEIEEKVNLLTDALTVMYNFGAINKTEPKLLNEEEILSGGQAPPWDLKILVSCNIINHLVIEPNKIDIFIRNLKLNVNKNSYIIALRWMRKAALDNDIVDRFVAYWIAFNALYSLHGEPREIGEQELIKRFVKNEFDNLTSEDFLVKQIGTDNIKIIYNSGLKLRSQDVTAELKTQWEQIKQGRSSDFMTCFELLVLSIYAVRNSIFHGAFLHGQRHRLVNASVEILIILLRCSLTKALSIV